MGRGCSETPQLRSVLQLGQLRSGLHSKAFAVDGQRLFIGSFNWDPRSVNINTEMGILVESPEVAQGAVRRMVEALPDTAYRLRLDDAGEIEWLERQPDGGWIAHGREPAPSGWQRFVTGLYGLLPVRGMRRLRPIDFRLAVGVLGRAEACS